MTTPKTNGIITLIGGAETRNPAGETLRMALKTALLPIVTVIPTASVEPRETYESYLKAFTELGAAAVHFMDVRYRHEIDDPKNLEMVAQAGLIFFTGGDQERLVDVFSGSRLLLAIRGRFREGLPLAGTSAGAMALGDPMIAEGNGTDGFQKGAVIIRPGFGFLKNIVVDTHFMDRCRIPRLAQSLVSGKADLGIGVSEDTGAVIYPDHRIRVIGTQTVTVLRADGLHYTNYHEIGMGRTVAADGLGLSFLTTGMEYDLVKRSAEQKKTSRFGVLGSSAAFRKISA